MILLNGLPAFFGVGLMHLTLINFLVMIIEYNLLGYFGKSLVKAGFVVLANIVSAVAGILIASGMTDSIGGNFWFGNLDDTTERNAFIAGLTVFILLTILIELPFYWLALGRKQGLKRVLSYTSTINLITNIPIAIYYLVEKMNYVQ